MNDFLWKAILLVKVILAYVRSIFKKEEKFINIYCLPSKKYTYGKLPEDVQQAFKHLMYIRAMSKKSFDIETLTLNTDVSLTAINKVYKGYTEQAFYYIRLNNIVLGSSCKQGNLFVLKDKTCRPTLGFRLKSPTLRICTFFGIRLNSGYSHC